MAPLEASQGVQPTGIAPKKAELIGAERTLAPRPVRRMINTIMRTSGPAALPGAICLVLLLCLGVTSSVAADQTPLATTDQATPAVDADISPPPERVTDQRAAKDEFVRNELQAVFDRVPGLNQVDVTVDAGVVRLQGAVVDAGTRTRAVAMAEQMEGVIFVDNRIQESTSLQEQLQPTWTRLRELAFGIVAKLPLFAVALVIVALTIWLSRLLARWNGPAMLRAGNPFLHGLIRRALQALVVIAGLIFALDLLDATALVGAVAGTAGLAGLALGFAFKDIVENYLAGILLAVRQPFARNDRIRVGEFEGTVVRLTPRETILMSAQGNHIRLPNALIFRSPLTNFTRNPLRRFEFEYGVGTNEDLAAVRELAVSTLRGIDGVLTDPPPQTHIVGLADSSVSMRSMGWIDQRKAEFERVRSEAIRLVKTRLVATGITLPSPEFLIRLKSDADPITARPPIPTSPTNAEQADVSVDHTVDQQIEIDRRVSDELDLLDRETPHGP